MRKPTCKIVRVAIAAVAALGLAVGAARAGSLEPTPGAVTSTMKPLDQVEPRTPVQSLAGSGTALHVISQKGSYYLTGDITAASSGHRGIEIAADNVTLDLMGFAIIGPGKGVGADDGILVSGSRSNIAISNGTIRDWGEHALDAQDESGIQLRSLRVLSNTAFGINCGFQCVVIECLARDNGSTGIQVNSDGIVTGSTSNNNGSGGFSGTGSTFNACTASNNGGVGLAVSSGSTVNACVASLNNPDGITASNDTTITGCTVTRNTGDGIQVSNRCLVSGNTANSNGLNGDGAGIHATVRGNRIEGNTVALNDRGIDTDDGATAEGNVVIKNTASCNGGTAATSTNATNYAVDAGDDLGPTNLPASSSTSPWANISIFGSTPCS